MSRTFEASGGAVTATVTVTGVGAGGCQVELLGADGAVLASGEAGAGPTTLVAAAPPGAEVTLELRALRHDGLSWQAMVVGAT